MTIQALINKRDNVEIIRDEIAAILAVETTSQQALATAELLDPRLWALRVFLERSTPWDDFSGEAPDQVDATPIVNVTFNDVSFDKSGGNVFERQRGDFVFHIDVYAYGVAADVEDGGHLPGDQAAALELHRAVRLVRNILMASEYTYLGQRGLVGRRWIQSITAFQPAIDGQAIEHVIAARLDLEVLMNEFSPQYAGVPLALLSISVRRSETGEVLIAGSIDLTEDEDS